MSHFRTVTTARPANRRTETSLLSSLPWRRSLARYLVSWRFTIRTTAKDPASSGWRPWASPAFTTVTKTSTRCGCVDFSHLRRLHCLALATISSCHSSCTYLLPIFRRVRFESCVSCVTQDHPLTRAGSPSTTICYEGFPLRVCEFICESTCDDPRSPPRLSTLPTAASSMAACDFGSTSELWIAFCITG